MTTILLILATIFLMAIGLAGTLIPALPGTILIFLGAALYTFGTAFETISPETLWILGGIALATQILDYIAGAYGARKFGSTKHGVWGSIVGGIIGMIVFNVIGLVLGIFLGAAAAEMAFAGKSQEHALKVGIGSVIGFLGGTVIKIILGVTMIGIFLIAFFNG